MQNIYKKFKFYSVLNTELLPSVSRIATEISAPFLKNSHSIIEKTNTSLRSIWRFHLDGENLENNIENAFRSRFSISNI